jgi:hypothetical protein
MLSGGESKKKAAGRQQLAACYSMPAASYQ